jgi:hypothetical protein
MRIDHLIDRDSVYKFVSLIHERARAAIAGMGDPRRPVLHLCSAAPDDARFFHSAYNIGDIGHMADDALIDSEAGRNVYIEPRLIRPGMPHERGRLEATLAVFACVADSDADTGKVFTAPVPASVVIETSPPANAHSWYFLRRAIGADDAQELGRLMRQSSGGDSCSGNPVQPFRCAGTVGYPNRKKSERGRVVVPTRIQRLTGITYTIDELRAAFQPGVSEPESPHVMPAVAVHCRSYSRSMAKMILAAAPGLDRSAQFMSAANHAARAGMTADEFEILARRFRDGCAGKYFESGDRLHVEIDRCFSKIAAAPARGIK